MLRYSSPTRMPPTPPSPRRQGRRKGIPSKAPSRSPKPSSTSTGDHTTVTSTINVSLLLRALMRDASLQNTRYSPASSPHKAVKRKERDTLPPVAPGYGRGKRGVSAALSTSHDELGSSLAAAGPSGRSRSPGPRRLGTAAGGGGAGTSTTGLGINGAHHHHHQYHPYQSTQHDGFLSTATSKQLKRSTSSEPMRLAVPPAASSKAMARASSAGPSSTHHGHPHLGEPSPLARSFSVAGSSEHDATSSSTTTTPVLGSGHARSSSIASSVGRESRRLGTPRNLQ